MKEGTGNPFKKEGVKKMMEICVCVVIGLVFPAVMIAGKAF